MALAVSLYVLISVGIGLWAARQVKNKQDFLVAGRRLPWLLSMSLLFSTWFGSETILGASQTFSEKGLLAVIEDPFGSALCLFLAGVWLAKPFYRLPINTFGDFYALHFGRWAERIATPLMAFSYVGWIAAQLVALAEVLSHFSGVSRETALILSTVVILSYTLAGGMWSVAAIDLAQNVILVGGLVVLLFYLPRGWFRTEGLSPDFLAFTPPPTPTAWLNYLAAWMVIGLGSLPQQDMYQRVVASKSARIAQTAAISAAVLYLTIGLIPLAAGLYIRLYHPEWLEGAETAPIIRLAATYLPPWAQFFFWGSLISAIMSSASGGILAPASLLSENILARWEKFSGLWRARLSTLVVGIICWLFARHNPNIYELVAESSIFSLVTLFVPMVVGLHLPRWRSAAGAILSMIAGVGAYYLAKISQTEVHPLWYGFAMSFVGYGVGHLIYLSYSLRQREPQSTSSV
jgi:Na+/proline symporter